MGWKIQEENGIMKTCMRERNEESRRDRKNDAVKTNRESNN